MSVELTKRECACLEHLQMAEGLGVTLKEYASAYGVDVNFLYTTKSQLVKKEVLPGAKPKPAADNRTDAAQNPFVAVQVEDNPRNAPPSKPAPVLKMKHRDGHLPEFAEWPPAAVLAMILSEARNLAA